MAASTLVLAVAVAAAAVATPAYAFGTACPPSKRALQRDYPAPTEMPDNLKVLG